MWSIFISKCTSLSSHEFFFQTEIYYRALFDTVPKSVSELSVKKDQPCLASPDKFVILGVQIKNYNLCYLFRS